LKIYLFEVSNALLLNEKILECSYQICHDVDQADAIIYGSDIQKLILSGLNLAKIKYIVSAREFNKKTIPFAQTRVDELSKFEAIFSDESISEVTNAIDNGIAEVLDGNSFNDIKNYLKLISLELVQNALLYGRNIDKKGYVEYKILRGEECYQIVVRDFYGMLDREIFYKNIKRAFEEKTYELKKSGAGLGLSMILSASDELSIIRKEGEFTEIRSIISKYKRLKEYKGKKTNLIFMEEY